MLEGSLNIPLGTPSRQCRSSQEARERHQHPPSEAGRRHLEDRRPRRIAGPQIPAPLCKELEFHLGRAVLDCSFLAEHFAFDCHVELHTVAHVGRDRLECLVHGVLVDILFLIWWNWDKSILRQQVGRSICLELNPQLFSTPNALRDFDLCLHRDAALVDAVFGILKHRNRGIIAAGVGPHVVDHRDEGRLWRGAVNGHHGARLHEAQRSPGFVLEGCLVGLQQGSRCD
mmetsp:Transcript_11346/g.28576  ORF Transcript_11346/g.28576 Transcript_11346/m.28576 type:complete len:229 (-) Transcript_11346:556-1242(-)